MPEGYRSVPGPPIPLNRDYRPYNCVRFKCRGCGVRLEFPRAPAGGRQATILYAYGPLDDQIVKEVTVGEKIVYCSCGWATVKPRKNFKGQ